jgi:hypothetical protein
MKNKRFSLVMFRTGGTFCRSSSVLFLQFRTNIQPSSAVGSVRWWSGQTAWLMLCVNSNPLFIYGSSSQSGGSREEFGGNGIIYIQKVFKTPLDFFSTICYAKDIF